MLVCDCGFGITTTKITVSLFINKVYYFSGYINMSQKTITSFYNSRKRLATDDIVSIKNKVPHIDTNSDLTNKLNGKLVSKVWEPKNNDSKEIIIAPRVTPISETKNIVKNKPFDNFQAPEAFTKKNNSNVPKVYETSQCVKSEITKTARKELSLGDIRKKLASSSRLAELKASADRISKGIQQLQQSSDKKNLQEFKSIDVVVPSSPSKRNLIQSGTLSSEPILSTVPSLQRPLISPRKVIVSPIKSPSKVPAYIKHAHLAASPTSLPLPHHYRFLAELFRSMETVVSLLYNRNEKITFTKLKPSIQEMLKRNFSEKHLAQIKHLVPDFYNFEIQRVKNSMNSQKDAYELIITPNIPNDIKILNPSVLLERRRYFFDILMQLVKKHHAQYLKTLDPPMEIPDDKLIRWHPEFELENVPEVESAKLPEMPNKEKYSTAQDVLAKARELFKCNTKMDRALEKLAQAKARGLTDEERAATGINEVRTSENSTQTQASTSCANILNPALRNLPSALLERVKAKQAAKALEAMTRSSDREQKYMVYNRLPDLVRTLRNIYVTERKNVLALNIVLSKLDSSFKSNVSSSDLQRDIKILTEEVPEIVKLHDLRNTTYLKFDRNVDLKKVILKLETLALKHKCD